MAEISTQLMGLSPEKMRQLSARLRQRNSASAGIQRQDRSVGEYPLSFAQQRMWLLDQMNPGNPALNISLSYRFGRDVNVGSLEKSFNIMLQRHEILRVRIENRNGVPRQVILPNCELKMPLIDLSDLPLNVRETRALALANEESRRPFDLSTGPLLRARVLKLSHDDYVLLWSIHHSAFDGTSGYLFEKEQTEIYEALCAGKPLPAPGSALGYVDYAVWQRNTLQGERLVKLFSYWKERVADAPTLNLPRDFARPAVYSYRGKTKSVTIPAQRVEALNELSRNSGATLYMMLLTVFKVLISRYAGQTDVVLGTPIANRDRMELEPLIGLFVNTLVLRTDLSGNPSFLAMLGRVRQTCIDAFAHQEMPFEELVRELNPERDLSRQPIFQVMFHFNSTPMSFRYQDDACDRLPMGTLFLNPGTALFDLTFSIEPASASETLIEQGALKCVMEYNTDLFEEATISRMLDHYLLLIGAVIENPNQTVLDLPILSAEERRHVLTEFNKSIGEFDPKASLADLLEEQVQLRPDHIALLQSDQQITYGGLNDRAGRLANYLRSKGAGPGTIVGVLMPRSPELVVALWAICKMGATYAPLDPTLPAERLSFLLDDLANPIVLTLSAYTDWLKAIPKLPEVIALDSDWEEIRMNSEICPVVEVHPDQAAYIIYTSGSTGRPKGVLVPYAAIRMHAKHVRKCYGLTPQDRALQFFQINLDGSLEQILSAHIAGAGLVLRDETLWTPEEFARKIVDYQITVINPLPAYLREVLRGLENRLTGPRHHRFRLIMIGGDAMLPEDIQLLQKGPISTDRLMHCYGPTEATIYATNLEIPAHVDGAIFSRKVPIGWPVEDRKVYILDSRLNPVPIGVPGEIHIGGAGLALGYLHRADITGERFIPDPFQSRDGARMYRTGDLARYLSDGNIEFIGRADHQVKIRGYRLELGEIEAALVAHPALRNAIVRQQTDRREGKQLVAYIIPKEDGGPTDRELRAYLKQHLPDYMIPASFIRLVAFPQTSTGKVDWKALPSVHQTRTERDLIAPRNEVEQALARIWSQTLGTESVGIEDNFFELGGDSILAIQIVAKSNQLGLTITQKDIFQYQTIAELSQIARSSQKVEAEQGPVTGPVPLTPIQDRFFKLAPQHPHHFNQTFLFTCSERLDCASLEKAIHAVISHHDALRMRYRVENGRWQQINSQEVGPVALQVYDLSGTPADQIQQKIEKHRDQLQSTLNLFAGPLMRAAYFDPGPKAAPVLILTVHHLVIDIISWQFLLEDIEHAYRQVCAGKELLFPLKTTSFKKWAEWQVERARALDNDAAALATWSALNDAGTRRLPRDFPHGENRESTVRACVFVLEEEATENLLRGLYRKHRFQANEILLGVLAMSLAQWTGCSHVLIDLEGHGRQGDAAAGVDISRTIGWFTAVAPIVLQAQEPDLEMLQYVAEKLRRWQEEAIQYGLLRYLSLNEQTLRRMAELPQAEISFNFLGQIDSMAAASSLFRSAPGSSGPIVHPSEMRSYLIDLVCWINDGRLQMVWHYSSAMHKESTIRSIGAHFQACLQRVLEECAESNADQSIGSDYFSVDLESDDLNTLMTSLQNLSLE